MISSSEMISHRPPRLSTYNDKKIRQTQLLTYLGSGNCLKHCICSSLHIGTLFNCKYPSTFTRRFWHIHSRWRKCIFLASDILLYVLHCLFSSVRWHPWAILWSHEAVWSGRIAGHNAVPVPRGLRWPWLLQHRGRTIGKLQTINDFSQLCVFME